MSQVSQENIWYVYSYETQKQEGPLSKQNIQEKIESGAIQDGTLLFQAGWSDWKPYSQCKEELQATPPLPAQEQPVAQKAQPEDKQNTPSNLTRLNFLGAKNENSPLEPIHQKRSKRISVYGQVIVHNNDNLVFAQSANISAEGIFVKTEKPIFNIGETLKLTCRVKAIKVPFNAEAQVVRRASGPSEPSGYGLFFTSIKPEISERIREITNSYKAAN